MNYATNYWYNYYYYPAIRTIFIIFNTVNIILFLDNKLLIVIKYIIHMKNPLKILLFSFINFYKLNYNINYFLHKNYIQTYFHTRQYKLNKINSTLH